MTTAKLLAALGRIRDMRVGSLSDESMVCLDMQHIADAAIREHAEAGVAESADAERWRSLRDLKGLCFSLSRDDSHACNYQTAKEWIEDEPEWFANADPAEIEQMKTTNTIWELQIYPRTPVGFERYVGASLDYVMTQVVEGGEPVYFPPCRHGIQPGVECKHCTADAPDSAQGVDCPTCGHRLREGGYCSYCDASKRVM